MLDIGEASLYFHPVVTFKLGLIRLGSAFGKALYSSEIRKSGAVAQLGERQNRTLEAVGSTPIGSTIDKYEDTRRKDRNNNRSREGHRQSHSETIRRRRMQAFIGRCR